MLVCNALPAMRRGTIGLLKSDRDFFAQDMELRQSIRSSMHRSSQAESLRQRSGIDDLELLGRLLDAGIDAQSWPAVQFIPVIFVAWASGEVTHAERESVTKILRQCGLTDDDPAVAVIQQWLSQRPNSSLWQLWRESLRFIRKTTPRLFRHDIADALLRYCNQVAQASGGLLGLGNVCSEEREILMRLKWDLESLEVGW